MECSNCGFVFCPYISQGFMERLYAEGYNSRGGKVPENGWSRIEFLEPALGLFKPNEPLKILDFGCGKVPDKLRQIGHRVIGVDITEAVRPHPDRITGSLLELKLEADQFDLTYSFQVFEHLSEPVPLFRERLRVTNPKGYILIHTDMELPERAEGFFQWWYVLPPDHCSFYKIKCFQTLLERTPHLLVPGDPKHVIIQKEGDK